MYMYIYIYTYTHLYVFIIIIIYISLSLYIGILYMPISVYYFLYLSRAFLAHVLRPNSFHCCFNFTSHCRSVTSLPQKKAPETCACFPLPCMCPSSAHLFPHSCDFCFRSPALGLKFLDCATRHRVPRNFWFGQAEKDCVYHRGRSWTLQHCSSPECTYWNEFSDTIECTLRPSCVSDDCHSLLLGAFDAKLRPFQIRMNFLNGARTTQIPCSRLSTTNVFPRLQWFV